MSFRRMRENLEQAFASHVANVQSRQSRLDPDRKLSIPVLEGPSGIGKTSCVEEFAREKGFQLIQLDCSFEPANFLAFRINNAINEIRSGQITGCVLLVNYIHEIDGEWRELFDQYRHNRLSFEVDVVSDGEKGKRVVVFDQIPAQVFVVGESRPDN